MIDRSANKIEQLRPLISRGQFKKRIVADVKAAGDEAWRYFVIRRDYWRKVKFRPVEEAYERAGIEALAQAGVGYTWTPGPWPVLGGDEGEDVLDAGGDPLGVQQRGTPLADD